MTDRAIIRLAEIAREYDQAGKPHYADIIEDAMMRLSQSAISNWWNGVKQVGQGFEDAAKSVGNAVAAPFEEAGAAGSAAWNQGIKNAPAAAQQAAVQSYGQAQQYAGQAMQNLGQGASAVRGPGGTGLAGAAASDAVSGVQNAAQGYINDAVTQQQQAQQTANMAQWLQQAIQAHRANGAGWQVIHNATQYGQLSPDNQATLKQQFAQAAAQFAPGKQ